MTSWVNLFKNKGDDKVNAQVSTKVDKKVDVKVDKKDIELNDDTHFTYNYGLKNEDDEFDNVHGGEVIDIIVEFRDLLEKSNIFLNINNKISDNLADYIKYYCHNYDILVDKVDKHNDKLEEEEDNENNDILYNKKLLENDDLDDYS
jgi:hypothetical protein